MSDQNNPHFNQIFWFICFSFTLVMALAAAVIFLPIPKENFNLANTVVIFFLGTVVGGGVGYLMGGNPVQPTKKPDTTQTDKMEVKADEVNVKQNENTQ